MQHARSTIFFRPQNVYMTGLLQRARLRRSLAPRAMPLAGHAQPFLVPFLNVSLHALAPSSVDSILWPQPRQVAVGDELETDRFLITGCSRLFCVRYPAQNSFPYFCEIYHVHSGGLSTTRPCRARRHQ